MFDEPINHASARLALQAFPDWGEAGPDDDLVPWTLDRLRRGRWSSTEESMLHLAAGLLGVVEYEVLMFDDDGAEVIERRQVPPLRDIVGAGFDPCRQAHALAALELAVVGARPAYWHWVAELA